MLLALTLGLGLVSVAQGQEGKPVEERGRPGGRGSAAEPESSVMTGELSRENQAVDVSRVVKFSGVFTDFTGKPLSGEVQVTFRLYKHETDEDPLWTETQRLEPDKQGAYTALLGSTQTDGVPSELFRADEARWLGVQVEGQPQQSRILFVSVPYALKAVEAEKLGGKSASDFVLSESLGKKVRHVIQTQGQVAAQPTLAGTATGKQSATNSTVNPQATSSGPMFPPSTFSGTTSDQVVLVRQNGSGSGLMAIVLAQGPTSISSTAPAAAASASLSFTAINFPGATRTRALGLNDRGDIMGDFIDSSGVLHGYVLSQGNFTNFNPPGSIQTRGLAINNRGVIGGIFLDSSHVRHSYLLNHGVFTIFDFPSATGTSLQDMNDLDQVVGTYVDSTGNTHGFLLSAGNFTTIDFPGALDDTAAFGITANGEIVGLYDDSNGVIHGFALIAGNFNTVDFPGAFLTEAVRANEAGQMVGIYNLAGQHGFLATPNPIQKP